MDNNVMVLLRSGKVLWNKILGNNNCIYMSNNRVLDSYNKYYSIDTSLDWIVVGDLNKMREMEREYGRGKI